MTDHHRECETLRLLSTYCPCICPQLDFHSGRAVVLAMDGLHDKVLALRDEAMDHERATGDPTFATAIIAYQTVLGLLVGSNE